MLLAVLSVCTTEELEDSSEEEMPIGAPREADAADPQAIEQRRAAIRNKILAVGKMRRIFQLLRSADLDVSPPSFVFTDHLNDACGKQRGVRDGLGAQHGDGGVWHGCNTREGRRRRPRRARQPDPTSNQELRRRVRISPILHFLHLISLTIFRSRRSDMTNERMPDFQTPSSSPSRRSACTDTSSSQTSTKLRGA